MSGQVMISPHATALTQLPKLFGDKGISTISAAYRGSRGKIARSRRVRGGLRNRQARNRTGSKCFDAVAERNKSAVQRAFEWRIHVKRGHGSPLMN